MFVVVVTGFSPSVIGAELVVAVLGPEIAGSGTVVPVEEAGAGAAGGLNVDPDEGPEADAAV